MSRVRLCSDVCYTEGDVLITCDLHCVSCIHLKSCVSLTLCAIGWSLFLCASSTECQMLVSYIVSLTLSGNSWSVIVCLLN